MMHINQELFAELNDEELKALEAISACVDYDGDAVVMREGEAGDALYILLEGAVAVTKRTQGEQVELLSLLTRGDCFGEMSSLSIAPRSATVTTVEPCTLRVIKHHDFHTFVDNYPRAGLMIYRNLSKTLSHRLRKMTEKFEALAACGQHPVDASTLPEELTKYVTQQLQTPATLLKGMADLLGHEHLSEETRTYYFRIMQNQAMQLVKSLKSKGK